MKASLRSVRISPKKANLVAKMVRGKTVAEARSTLEHTPKKASRILEKLINSAVANAQHNDDQDPETLVVKTLIVNKGIAYHRGVPMARGRVRPMRKFLSHISLTLGVNVPEAAKPEKAAEPKKPTAAKKPAKDSSQTAKKTVKKTSTKAKSSSKSEKGSSTTKKKTTSTSKASSRSTSKKTS